MFAILKKIFMMRFISKNNKYKVYFGLNFISFFQLFKICWTAFLSYNVGNSTKKSDGWNNAHNYNNSIECGISSSGVTFIFNVFLCSREFPILTIKKISRCIFESVWTNAKEVFSILFKNTFSWFGISTWCLIFGLFIIFLIDLSNLVH